MENATIVPTLIAVAALLSPGVIWLLRLEGRLNTHEGQCAERQKRMDERHEAMLTTLGGMDEKLNRLMERTR